MAIVRVQESVAVQHPDIPGQLVALQAGRPFEDTDQLVRAYPWAFAADDVEQATAGPGEKRNVKR